MPHESSERASFDVIVSSLEGGVWTDASLFSTLKDRLEPGGVLCVFVRTPEPGASDLVREDVVWTVAGSIAHAGFDVLFAEGSEHLQTVVPRLVRALRSLLELFTPRKFRENVARFLHRMNLCPRHALVVARRSFA
jgi:SAM-dependent methyltransferase